MFQHLTNIGSWICFWPDVPHKFQRKQAMALSHHEMAKMKLKQFMKVFRSNRAPFSTSKFGKALKEAKQRLLTASKKDPDHELLQMFLPGIARDLGCDPSHFTAHQAIRALAVRAGSVHVKATECKDVRWGAWLDHAQAWDACWHCEAMVMLYAMWEAGENPWTGQQQVLVEASDERAYSIKKIRWQAYGFSLAKQGFKFKSVSSLSLVESWHCSATHFKFGENPQAHIQVLSDDQNQNYMRSMIAVFRQARVYVGKFAPRTETKLVPVQICALVNPIGDSKT